jgi:LemA protein
MAVYIVLGILVLLALYCIGLYNGLIRTKNQVDNAYASIDVQLKKRYDLIPNLVETVKQHMKFESETLEKIVALRSQAGQTNLSTEDKVKLDNQISTAVKGLMVSVEAYPDLKSSQNFLQLQGSWNEIEEQVAASRRFYNSSVNNYNNAIQVFPSRIFAGMLGMTTPKTYFEAEAPARESLDPKRMWN